MATRPYTVHIYEEEAEFISLCTLRYPNIETGGDLFGLWLNDNEVVIQLVLGPGKNCRRTTTSFFQDEEYLSDVGGFLTSNQGLCNVGSWHSHHSMNLPEPSQGDRDTVWRHLPTPGRFLLLIATVRTKVGMCFSLFESSDKRKEVVEMKISILKGRSPIRDPLNSRLKAGAEVVSQKTFYPEARKQPRAKGQGGPKEDLHGEGRHREDRHREDRHREDRRREDRHREDQNKRHRENQNITCSGVPIYGTYGTFGHGSKRIKSHKYIRVWGDPYNGKQGLTIYHRVRYQDNEVRDHVVGGCEICRDDDDFDCCTIL